MTGYPTLTTLKVAFEAPLATVELNRASVRHAFNEVMLAELTEVFTALDAHDEVRAVVLSAHGPAFCAGADLQWMKRAAQFSDAENRADALCLASMLGAIYRCSKPVIARVQGDAYAGGVGLIAASDIVVAADSARFCLSETRLGLVAAVISPYVIRALGERACRRYFLSAELFDSAEALRLGLVHQVSPANELDAAVAHIARTLCANGPNAVRESKRLVQHVADSLFDEALIEHTVACIARVRASAEAREGMMAFLDKRAPAWRAHSQ